ncbi:hypothetical protein PQ459_10085 [Chryseobacterium sp. KACC 21268]|nr:hypothetical protein PQ459_10085 [Chryseobacterium sp. KACC 21268]
MKLDLQKIEFENLDFNNLPAELINNTQISLLYDEFEETKTIEFTRVGYGIDESFTKNDFSTIFKLYVESNSTLEYFGLSFVNHNGYAYMDIFLRGSDIKLVSGDYFIILFEDDIKKKFQFQNPAKSTNSYISNNSIELTQEDLVLFLSRNILKVKVVSLRKNIYNIYKLNELDNTKLKYFFFQYWSKESGQILLRYMTYLFIDFNLKNKI